MLHLPHETHRPPRRSLLTSGIKFEIVEQKLATGRLMPGRATGAATALVGEAQGAAAASAKGGVLATDLVQWIVD